MTTVADHIISSLKASGISRVYGLSGDSLNGLTDALRRDGSRGWIHVRHEESGAFAAAAEAGFTGELAVYVGSCGPGNIHLINDLSDAYKSRVPVRGPPECPLRVGVELLADHHDDRVRSLCPLFRLHGTH